MSLISTLLSGTAPSFKGQATTYLVENYRDNPKKKPAAPKKPHVAGANMIEMRRQNKELVLKFIRLRKTSANKLVEKTGVCRTSISNITNELITEGLIECDKSSRPWRYSVTKKGKC
jgi:predicted transcriptional regulator